MPDLSAQRLLDQARKLHGNPFPGLALGRGGFLSGKVSLPIPGWPLGVWRVVDGRVGPLLPAPEGSFRLLWLAETGALVYAMVDSGVFSDDSAVIVADTAGDFWRHALGLAPVGRKVWDDAVVRLPALSAHAHDPLGGWAAEGSDPSLRGGIGLLVDPAIRRLNEPMIEAVRDVAESEGADLQGSVLSWEGVKIDGVWAYTAVANEVHLDGGRVHRYASPVFVAGVALTSAGSWVAVHALNHDERGFNEMNLRFFDTLGDLYRFCAAPEAGLPQMQEAWAFLRRRYSLLPALEAGALARWR